MKFTLKDYQRDAVRDALNNLKDAQDDWRRKSRKCAFSLTAVTGAGKTVMAPLPSRRCFTVMMNLISMLILARW